MFKSYYHEEIIGESDEKNPYNPPKEDEKYDVRVEHVTPSDKSGVSRVRLNSLDPPNDDLSSTDESSKDSSGKNESSDYASSRKNESPDDASSRKNENSDDASTSSISSAESNNSLNEIIESKSPVRRVSSPKTKSPSKNTTFQIYKPKIFKKSVLTDSIFSTEMPSLDARGDVPHTLQVEKNTVIDDFKVSSFIREDYNNGNSYQFYKLKKSKYEIRFSLHKNLNEINVLKELPVSDFLPEFPEKFNGKIKELKLYYLIQEKFKFKLDEEKNLNENDVLNLSLRLLDGLRFLHSNGLVFSEMMPSKFSYDVLDDIKFTDFRDSEPCVSKDEERCRGEYRELSSRKFNEYSSINVQKGSRLSPESDIESLIYLIHALKNSMKLPWSNEKGNAMLRLKETYIPESSSLEKVLIYLRTLKNSDIIDYDYIKAQFSLMNKKRIPKDEDIFIQKENENSAKFRYRMLLYDIIRDIDLEDLFGFNVLIKDDIIMRVTELLLARHWYETTYDDKTENALNRIENMIFE